MYPRFRAHVLQRRTIRLLNFGVRSDRTTSAFRAIKWNKERSDYIEFSSEFAPFLGQIPGTLQKPLNIQNYGLKQYRIDATTYSLIIPQLHFQ